MDTQAGSEGALRFGSFELDERARELRTGTTRIRLQDQPFEILRLLLLRPGQRVRTETVEDTVVLHLVGVQILTLR